MRLLSQAVRGAAGLALMATVSTAAIADEVLFENVRIFDGHSTALSPPSNVLVRDNLIRRYPRRRSRPKARRGSTAAGGP